MEYSVRAIFGATLVAFLIGGYAPAQGMALYQTCFKNSGIIENRGGLWDAAFFQATLQQGGLFYKWSGFSATVKDGKCETPQKPDLFKGSNEKGQIGFGERLSPVAPPGGHLVLQEVDNGVNWNRDATYFFTSFAAKLATTFGPSLKLKDGDPVLEFTNDTGGSITLLDVEARVNNLQDPFNVDELFVPDGTIVPILPELDGDLLLAPNARTSFSFALLDNTSNWSFQYAYMDSTGAVYVNLVAAAVPEPGSVMLTCSGLALLLGGTWVRRRRLQRGSHALHCRGA